MRCLLTSLSSFLLEVIDVYTSVVLFICSVQEVYASLLLPHPHSLQYLILIAFGY